MDTVSHLAGPWITIEGRGIQRCLICGEKLIDTKGQASADGDNTPLFWGKGCFVQVTVNENPQRWSVLPDNGERLPKDSCIDLVE